jgi:hypothetical protein
MSILWLREDVTLLRERVDMSILWLRKDVTLLRERVDMSILWLRKDVTLLREGRTCLYCGYVKMSRY